MKIAGRYEPTGATAAGGMGEIIECVDSHLQRRVIIKRLQVGVEDRRLIDEQKALAQLRSKHVVQLYDIIELADREKHDKAIVIEFIEGENLDVGSFKADRKYLNVLWQIACGLRDIHDAGVIHRDIKPNNIRLDKEGVIKIIDFGLARSDDNAKTRSVIGTPIFMAPELWSDKTVSFDRSIDVYAFGATSLALLNGSAPTELARQPPEPVPLTTLRAGLVGLQPDIVALIHACLTTESSQAATNGRCTDCVGKASAGKRASRPGGDGRTGVFTRPKKSKNHLERRRRWFIDDRIRRLRFQDLGRVRCSVFKQLGRPGWQRRTRMLRHNVWCGHEPTLCYLRRLASRGHAVKNGDVVSGRYVVQNHIGRGGMQDVYLALDQLLGIEVALKTPQAGQPDKRFSQSAIIAARVNHHNVAKTFDYFEENNQLFLIEEFVPGETLEAKLSRFGAVDPHLAARVFHHLSRGVAASHHAGVVHRDLKPSNIIAEPGVNIHELKITDFGIATLTEEVFAQAAKAGDLTRSTSGTIRGALPYMAPEMMFRSPGDHPGREADIWSLGAMMFRILTGEYPFGVYLQAAVNVQNQKRALWPAFMTSNNQYRPLAVQLQNLVEQCLTYDPAKRPSADQLVKDISNICYINVHRSEGTVSNLIQNGYSGFADGDNGKVFFSMESVYGVRRPSVTNNNRICYSQFPGAPRDRGHPVVVMD